MTIFAHACFPYTLSHVLLCSIKLNKSLTGSNIFVSSNPDSGDCRFGNLANILFSITPTGDALLTKLSNMLKEPEGDHVEPEGDHGEPQPPEEPSGETNNEIFHDDKENRNPKDAVPASIEDKTDDEPGPSNRSPDGSNPKRRRVL